MNTPRPEYSFCGDRCLRRVSGVLEQQRVFDKTTFGKSSSVQGRVSEARRCRTRVPVPGTMSSHFPLFSFLRQELQAQREMLQPFLQASPDSEPLPWSTVKHTGFCCCFQHPLNSSRRKAQQFPIGCDQTILCW